MPATLRRRLIVQVRSTSRMELMQQMVRVMQVAKSKVGIGVAWNDNGAECLCHLVTPILELDIREVRASRLQEGIRICSCVMADLGKSSCAVSTNHVSLQRARPADRERFSVGGV